MLIKKGNRELTILEIEKDKFLENGYEIIELKNKTKEKTENKTKEKTENKE